MAPLAAPQAQKAWNPCKAGCPMKTRRTNLASAETRYSYGALYLGLAGLLR